MEHVSVNEIINHISELKGLSEVDELNRRLFLQIYELPSTSNEERNLLTTFSIFNGKVKLEAIKAVFNGNAISVLIQLGKKMLITKSDIDSYEMHPLIREFSNVLLENKNILHKRAFEYFLSLRKPDLDVLLEETIFFHLSKALEWQILLEQIIANGRIYIRQGLTGFLKEILDVLISRDISDPLFDIFYGDIYQIRGNWELAFIHFEKAMNESTSKEVKVEGKIKFAEMLYRKGKVKESLPVFQDGLILAQNFSFEQLAATAENDIGLVYDVFGEFDIALEHLNIALEKRRSYSKEDVGETLNNIGRILYTKEEFEKYLSVNQQCLNHMQEIRDKEGISRAWHCIGLYYFAKKKFAKALEYFNTALKIVEEITSIDQMQSVFCSIGDVYSKRGQLDIAIDYLDIPHQTVPPFHGKLYHHSMANCTTVPRQSVPLFSGTKWDKLEMV